MPGRLADLLQHLPAARALLAMRRRGHHADAADVRQGEGTSRRLARHQIAARRDANLAEVEALQGSDVLGRGMDVRGGLQAGADALLRALEFEREARWQDASSMREALRWAMMSVRPHSSKGGSRREKTSDERTVIDAGALSRAQSTASSDSEITARRQLADLVPAAPDTSADVHDPTMPFGPAHPTSEHELYLKLFITNGGGW